MNSRASKATTTGNDTSVMTAVAREQLSRAGTSSIANVLLKHGFTNAYMLGVGRVGPVQSHMIGPAYTLRFIPSRPDIDSIANYNRSDNLHRRAVEECPSGAVLVIDAQGCTRAASAGDIMVARLKVRGVSGIVTDGGYRDTPKIGEIGLPAYQRRSAPPATPIAMRAVELNGPVGCAGVPAYPGDIIVGDDEGVVVIPQALVNQIAEEVDAVTRYEAFVEVQIARGRSIFGLFPPTAESQLEFEKWEAAGSPR